MSGPKFKLMAEASRGIDLFGRSIGHLYPAELNAHIAGRIHLRQAPIWLPPRDSNPDMLIQSQPYQHT